MSLTLTTIPPEILDKIIKEIASPRASKPPLARRPTIGDRCLGDVSRNNQASSTLSSLSQTCKTLHTHCLPQIFGTITISRRDGLHRLKKTLERSKVLANLARKNTRSISIDVEFRLFKDVSRFGKNQKHIKQLGSVLRCCSSLTALHLTNVFFDLSMVRILAQIKTLRSLSFESVYSGTKISKMGIINELCREDQLEFDEELPLLESLHFSPPLLDYSYDTLVLAARSSLKELSIHYSTACRRWSDKLASRTAENIILFDEVYFPCLERIFIQRLSLSLPLSHWYSRASILPFLYRHRETLREFTLLPLDTFRPVLRGRVSVSFILLIMRYMAGEIINMPGQHDHTGDDAPMRVDGFSVVLGEWLARSVEGGRRKVLELGISLGEERMKLGVEFDFPMLDLGALLGPECFDQIELIAFSTIYKHTFFFSEFITQLENICATRFTNLKDISLSWDARDTCWSRSEPRRFTELPSNSGEDSCELNEEWITANYSVAENIICGLFRRTAIERLELVPVFRSPGYSFDRAENFPPFESWVWQKSQCGSKVHGTLWKRPKRAHFIAVGIGSERETDSYWADPSIDDDESDELQDWQLQLEED